MIIKNGKRLDGFCVDSLPIGTLQPYLGLKAPNGYLICDGSLISKTMYPELYIICGSLFGTETSTHFYLPDLRGKTIAGYNADDSTLNTIGKLLGAISHTHTSAAHTHTVAGHTHTSAAHTHSSAAHSHSTGNHTLTESEVPSHHHSFTTAAAGNHTHRIYLNGDNSFPLYGHPGWNGEDVANAAKLNCGSGAFNGYHFRAGADATGGDGSHQHTGSVSWSGGGGAHNHGNTGSTTPGNTGSTTPGATGSTSLTTNSTTPGATGSSSNYQPTMVANWIVKAKNLIPVTGVVENSLESTSELNALSAAQGKILNTSIQTVENRVAAIERGILVKYAEGFDTTSLNIEGLDIDRDGGIYDIYIYAYHNSDSPSDYFMSINNNTTTSYKTIRTFARHDGDTTGQGTVEAPFFNADLGHWIIGDACNRFMFKGSLMLLQEQTTKVPRLQGTSTVAENTYQSIINSGGYFNPNEGVNNITSIQIHGVYFKEIRVYIYKKIIA